MGDPIVIVLGDPAETPLEPLKSLAGAAEVHIAKTAEGLGDAVARAEVLYAWNAPKAELQKIVAGAPNLKWIQSRSAGLDSFLFPELVESDIPLTNGTGVFSESLGEFVIAGAMYFAKDMPRMLASKAAKRWDVFNVKEISKQTIGIIAHGDIGRATARRAKALGMRVLALRRDLSPRPGDEHVDKLYPNTELHAMLPECDYVVSTAPLTADTKHMLSTAEFALMKPSAVVMNVGRGPVIDEAALAEALRTKRIRGAFLDVFEKEPLPESSPLWDLDNVFISAHTADHTEDWLSDAVTFFIQQFGRFVKGEPLKNVVDKRAGY